MEDTQGECPERGSRLRRAWGVLSWVEVGKNSLHKREEVP